jgi:hypothetical protein
LLKTVLNVVDLAYPHLGSVELGANAVDNCCDTLGRHQPRHGRRRHSAPYRPRDVRQGNDRTPSEQASLKIRTRIPGTAAGSASQYASVADRGEAVDRHEEKASC